MALPRPRDDFAALSLRALTAALRNGEITAEAVTAYFLDRIATINPDLHAMVRLAPDALERARQADLARARGDACGTLHGVPFSVKDWIEVSGLVCDAGFVERRDFVPRRDATVVARLRAAGAIVLGKSKTGDNANTLHPACANPRAPGRTPGASSSGEAALVAAGATAFGLGSDSGGSIRWPAHCCGVAGLKPTSGRVPNTGHFPRIGALQDPRTVIGPLARQVDDLACVLERLVGPDGIDTGAVPVPLDLDDPHRDRPWRIAWFAGWSGEPRARTHGSDTTTHTIDTDTTGQVALRTAVAALADAGHTLVEAIPPHIAEARFITETYWTRTQSVSLHEWRPAPSGMPVDAIALADVEYSLFLWERLRRAMLGFLHDHDLLLCPGAPRIAPVLGDKRIDDYAFTLPFSLTGQPVVCLPTAWTTDGIPASVQVIAPAFLESRAIAAARQIESRVRTPVA